LGARTVDSRATNPSQAVAPRFRGVAHLGAFLAAVPVGVLLVLHARSGVAQVGAAVFAASVTFMLGSSSLFHRRRWTAERMRWIGLLDHAAIYVLIAGTYTPFALLVLHPAWRLPILAIAWGGALAATLRKLFRPHAPAWVAAATCVALGWVSVIVMPQIIESIKLGPSSLLAAGGIAYTAGALVYVRRKPDPFPDSFGYHEVFHALVIAAVACQYTTIAFFVLPNA
jgi:hemolysin III